MEKNEVLVKIGIKIRKLREEKNLSLQDLSDKCDFEKPNLIRIEKGRTNPTIGTLLKIAQVLNVRLAELVDVDVE
jgi:transcriptional regulator with XRE-family HTH domain